MTFFQGKKGKSKSYAELGAGYDENDPFIDNTEAVSFNMIFFLVQCTSRGFLCLECIPIKTIDDNGCKDF